LCALLFLRGLVSALETAGWSAAESAVGVGTILGPWQANESKIVETARGCLLLFGIGDVLMSLAGTVGIVLWKAVPMAGLSVWLLVRLFLEAFILMVATVCDTSGAGGAVTFVIGFLVMLFELYLALVGLELLLVVTLRGTVSAGAVQVISRAQMCAVQDGKAFCDRTHLLASLLQDAVARRLLQLSGLDVGQLMRTVPQATDHMGPMPGTGVDIPFAPDAEIVLFNAALGQSQEGDAKMNVDHICCALCITGYLTIGEHVYDLDPHAISVHIREAKNRRECPEGTFEPPTTTIFWCLPIEEVVAAWSVARIAAFVGSCLLWLIGYGFVFNLRSVFGGASLGIHVMWEMRILEAFTTTVAVLFSIYALMGIWGHRQARWRIYDKVQRMGEDWVLGLGEAFEICRNAKPVDPRTGLWLTQLKKGVTYTRLFFFWSILELALDIPIIGMYFSFGNVCGTWHSGVSNISRQGIYFSTKESMHCTRGDFMLIFAVAAWVAFKCTMAWTQFLLWHLYQHGWATDEQKGLEYLKSPTMLPEPTVRSLAGLSRYVQKHADVHHSMFAEHPDEAKPLLKQV